ncbi:MAG: M13 family metallopeptidase [Bacteroidetes bacterium]|nr:M13 family metallopeptidase [Bacteroidota bacterium]
MSKILSRSLMPLAGAGILALAMTVSVNKAIDPQLLDKRVRPQDDFFEYVNGLWIRSNPIPATEVRWGNFNVLNERSQKALRDICEGAAASQPKPGTDMQRIGDFYASGMDSVQVEKMGFSPLKPELAMIDALKDKKGITDLMAEMHLLQVGAGFGYFVMADQKNSNQNAPYLSQSGLGLPDRDYYSAPEMKELADAYKAHINAMFALMGDDKKMAQENAEMVFALESKLAEKSMTAVEQRDPDKLYNKMTQAELNDLCPNFNFAQYFEKMGTPSPGDMIVMQPDFMKGFNALMDSEPIEAWRAYFRWQLVHSVAGKLHSDVVNEHFKFYGTMMSGQRRLQPRWKRVLASTEGALGEAMGKIYVEKNFSSQARDRVNEMVDNLTEAYKERIKTRPWMSEQTKGEALKKLSTIMRKLGYPDKWRDYSGLDVTRESYVRNYLNSNKFDAKYLLSRINQPVDKTEWGMTPATINAYYNPAFNEIVFPAAIMQAPFFDPDADDAVNYGAMGAVIGHELTHGFDDEGSKYDSEGNLRDWWTADDRKAFEIRAKVLIDQFNSFVAIDSLKLTVNGQLTLGENIADLGGLTISYAAYQRSLKGKTPAKIDGFTGAQRFFISWAQAWRGSMRPKALMNMVKTDPHAPQRFRVIGPLSNMKEFYDAFGVKAADKMYRKPEERAEIW